MRAVAFLQPCIFDEPRNLQCVLRSEESGHSFAIYSCAVATETEEAAPEPPWILHATGELFSDARGQSLPENLDAIRERCGKAEDSRSFYEALDEMDVHFGSSFRSVTRVFRGADEALVEFALPPNIEADADHYQIHPIALDACFQSVVAILLSAAHGPDAIYLPAALEELCILGDPRRLTLAHARLHRANPSGKGAPVTADVYGFDRSGHLLLSATGLVLRPLNPEDQERTRFNQISNSLYEVAWIPVETATQDAFNMHGRDAQQSAHAAATAATKAIQGTWVLAGAADEPLSSSLSDARRHSVRDHSAGRARSETCYDPERDGATHQRSRLFRNVLVRYLADPAGRGNETRIADAGAVLADRASAAGSGSENHPETLDCDQRSSRPSVGERFAIHFVGIRSLSCRRVSRNACRAIGPRSGP